MVNGGRIPAGATPTSVGTDPVRVGAPMEHSPVVLDLGGLDALIAVLHGDGYRVVGPVVRDGAITLGPLGAATDLPIGWGDEQAPGRYRLVRRGDTARFGYAVGPDSPRRELSPPEVALVTIRRRGRDFEATAIDHTPAQPVAFIGLRGCELAAMRVHARVMVDGEHPDRVQQARMARRFIVAVDCGAPAATCFCTSMQTGPAADGDADLRLCELVHDAHHRFVCWARSADGVALLQRLPYVAATPDDLAAADAVVSGAVARITTRLHTDNLPARLAAAPSHPRWDDIASRCLSCTSCTLVCPTCFCSDIRDHAEVDGETTTRTRTWDSCFTLDHSHLSGGAVHDTTRARYRQWMTHKLSTWWDQFGESGCVGCGRCTTWCPAAIDFVAEANLITSRLSTPVALARLRE
jgi:formate hydrogenlyase subunit 6/NADH:ubiquinone oxidoreductase subunit I